MKKQKNCTLNALSVTQMKNIFKEMSSLPSNCRGNFLALVEVQATTKKRAALHKPSTKRFALTLGNNDGEENADENIREMEAKNVNLEILFQDFSPNFSFPAWKVKNVLWTYFKFFESWILSTNHLNVEEWNENPRSFKANKGAGCLDKHVSKRAASLVEVME